MTKKTRKILSFVVASIYLTFACLYVVACNTNASRTGHFKATFGGFANNPNHAHGYFLSRPRVVKNRSVLLYATVAVLLCFFSFPDNRVYDFVYRPPNRLHVQSQYKFVLLRTLRV